MQTKVFVLLLVAVMVLGVGLGGAFAAGIALGKSQGKDAAIKTLPTQPTPGSGQPTQGQFTPEQLQQFRQQFQGQMSQEQLDQMRQQFQGQAGQGSRMGGGGLTGTIEGLQGNTVTVNTAQGPLQATIGADTTIQTLVAGSLNDLKTGLRITVVGQRGEDGTVTARSILITPAGADGFFGGGSPLGGSQ